jgi:hypothetical protein
MNQTKNGNAMNLYILNDVLHDYTAGMAVIAAESMEQCKELFMAEFCYSGASNYLKGGYKDIGVVVEDFNTAKVKVIEGVNYAAGVVSYVYGGG